MRIGEVADAPAEVKAEAEAPKTAALPVSEEAEREIKSWQLKVMSKSDIMGILRKRYNVDVDEAVTKRDMIDRLVALQAKHNTNQDIAAAVKG